MVYLTPHKLPATIELLVYAATWMRGHYIAEYLAIVMVAGHYHTCCC
jgi:hypothetical protein